MVSYHFKCNTTVVVDRIRQKVVCVSVLACEHKAPVWCRSHITYRIISRRGSSYYPLNTSKIYDNLTLTTKSCRKT